MSRLPDERGYKAECELDLNNAIRHDYKVEIESELRWKWDDEFIGVAANKIMREAVAELSKVDARFSTLRLQEGRMIEALVGPVDAEGGDPLKPRPKHHHYAAKLLFSTGDDELYQANGAGGNFEEALAMAVHTALDFRCFQIEQERAQSHDPLPIMSSVKITPRVTHTRASHL